MRLFPMLLGVHSGWKNWKCWKNRKMSLMSVFGWKSWKTTGFLLLWLEKLAFYFGPNEN